MLDNDSFVIAILDYQKEMSLACVMVINSLVGSRINKELSIKVATDIDICPVYYDLSGSFVESTHDYGEVELDDNAKEYTKRMKLKYQINYDS